MIHYDKMRVPQTWDEITLEQCIEVKAKGYDSSIDVFEQLNQVRAIWDILIKGERAINIAPITLIYYFQKYLVDFVNDLNRELPKTYTPQLIKSFLFKGKTYYLPDSLVIDEETVVLMHGERVKNFIEASNLLTQFAKLKNEGIKAMPIFLATVLRESKDEPFSEVAVIERAKKINELGMDLVWEVFFCYQALIYKSVKDTLQSLTATQKKAETVQASRLGRLRLRKVESWEHLKKLMRQRYGILLKYWNT